MTESDATRGGVASTSSTQLALAWICLAVGALLVWMAPLPRALVEALLPFLSTISSHPPKGEWAMATVDALLSPLVCVLLFIFVRRWTDRRGAWASVALYVVLLVVWLSLLFEVPKALATRNFSVGGSAQLLVGLAGLLLLQARALPPLAWSAILVAASAFHPQYAFVPLLMVTIVEWRTVLTGPFIAQARGAALRCAGLSLLVQGALKLSGRPGLPNEAVTMPLAWWLASWLLDGEPLMPGYVRALAAGIMCVSTVADFKPWPAIAVVLLVGWLASAREAPRAEIREHAPEPARSATRPPEAPEKEEVRA